MQSDYKTGKDVKNVLYHEPTMFNYKENNNNVK